MRTNVTLSAWMITLILSISVKTTAQTIAKAMPADWAFFLGEWESQTYNNRYQMSITFNETANQFEGVLTKQGEMSQIVGFSLGELCWTASPSIDGKTVTIQQKWRTGSNGKSVKEEWKPDAINMSRTTKDRIITNGGLDFVRILEFPAAAGDGVLPSKTVVPARFTKNLTSEDPILAEAIVTKDVKDAAGNTIIANGTPIEVKTTKTAAAPGKGGNITVSFLSVKAVDGTLIKLLGDFSVDGKNGASFLMVNGQPMKGKPANITDTTNVNSIITSVNYLKQQAVITKPIEVNKPTSGTTTVGNPYDGKKLCFHSKTKECEADFGTYVTCSITLTFKADSVYGSQGCGGCGGSGSSDYSGIIRGDTLFLMEFVEEFGAEGPEMVPAGNTVWLLKADKLYQFETAEQNGKMVIKNPKAPTYAGTYNKTVCPK